MNKALEYLYCENQSQATASVLLGKQTLDSSVHTCVETPDNTSTSMLSSWSEGLRRGPASATNMFTAQ